MIYRAKVLKGLECCADFQRQTMNRNCFVCPYGDRQLGMCKSLYPLMRDAHMIISIRSVPLEPLAKWLAGYAMPPVWPTDMSQEARAAAWEEFLGETEWEADE